MTVLDILCLANSYKLGGRCIAGLRIDGEGWIRPQAHTPHGELHPAHYLLPDGSFPRMLDVIRIPFERREPLPHQPENWLIADGPWKLIHRGPPPYLAPLLRANLASTPLLLGDRSRRIPFDRFTGMPARSSLALVSPPDLAWEIDRTPYNARKPSALFSLAGAEFKLPVTDPIWLDAFRALPPGTHPLAACGIDPASQVLLTVSLGEPFDDGHCYKLVSAIIPMAPKLLQGHEAPLPRWEAAWILEALRGGWSRIRAAVFG